MSNNTITTERLRLVLVLPQALEMLLSADVSGASRVQGFEFSDDFLLSVNDIFLTRQLEGIRRNPSAPGWSVRAILRDGDDQVVGHCGFHGTPKDVGRAEIGYTTFTPYRRCGYATESARGLVEWARSQGTHVVFAAVSPSNDASLAVVRQLGFQRTGVQENHRHQEEWVFELAV